MKRREKRTARLRLWLRRSKMDAPDRLRSVNGLGWALDASSYYDVGTELFIFLDHFLLQSCGGSNFLYCETPTHHGHEKQDDHHYDDYLYHGPHIYPS